MSKIREILKLHSVELVKCRRRYRKFCGTGEIELVNWEKTIVLRLPSFLHFLITASALVSWSLFVPNLCFANAVAPSSLNLLSFTWNVKIFYVNRLRSVS